MYSIFTILIAMIVGLSIGLNMLSRKMIILHRAEIRAWSRFRMRKKIQLTY